MSRSLFILVAVLTMAVGEGCSREGSADAPAIKEKLTLAAPAVPHTALLQIAAAKGFFAQEGLEVTIVPTATGPEAVGLVTQGKADLATAAEVVVVLAILKGQPLAILASMLSAHEIRVVARRDRDIAGLADLRTKKVGLTYGTSAEYFVWAQLKRLKLPRDSISLVNLPPDRIPGALADSSVDAVAAWQPIVSRAQAALGQGNSLLLKGEDVYTETHVIGGRSEFLAKHPQAIVALVRALLKSEQFIRSQPQEASRLLAERLALDAATLGPTLKDFSFRLDLRESQLINLEDQATWAMELGYAARGPVHNFQPNLYLDALLAVSPDRVTVLH